VGRGAVGPPRGRLELPSVARHPIAQFAAVHESAFGTKRTFRHVCSLSAFGGKADIICSFRAFPLLTRTGHEGAAFAALREPSPAILGPLILGLCRAAEELRWSDRRVVDIELAKKLHGNGMTRHPESLRDSGRSR